MTEMRMTVLEGSESILGESPVWLGHDGVLAWVDMPEGTIARYLDSDGSITRQHVAPYLGAIVPTQAGTLAALTVDSIASVTSTGLETLTTVITDPTLRLNDAACDSHGRLWVGSTSVSGLPGRGALHVWDGAGEPRVVVDELSQPNGIGWSPDGSQIYFVDTAAAILYRAPVSPSGELGAATRFIDFADEEPDGLCVDAEGALWVAMWNGREIRRYAPDGSLLYSLALPVSRPTSCAFAEDGRLFVTSARYELDEHEVRLQPLAGSVFQIHVGVNGAPVGSLSA